ncbi:MAG TPA: relaxase/mobilization nuclease domain-containing protein [Acidobacteriaceae bacterium]
MIAKGNLHSDGGGLARYLLTGEKDEIAHLVETRGLESFGTDPVRAFETLQKVAEANTKSPMPFFHVQTRNPDGDKQLTDEQWLEIADREEKRLGLSDQPRIVSFHIDRESGEKHLHVGWFRIDLETMRAIDSGLYKNHLKQLCRSLEKEYGLQEVSNFRKPEDRARAADRKEVEEARRLGTDVRAVRAIILDCLERTDGGKAFRAALDERGLMLSNGDKRDCFVVIDQAGGQHALNKKLTGLTLAAMRDRLGDLDRAQLPSVEKAKAMQHEKFPTPEQARDAAQADRPRNLAGHYDSLRPEARHPAYAPEPEKARPETREQERPAASAQATQGERWHERNATKMEEKIFRVMDAADRGGASVVAGLHAEGITLARVDDKGREAIQAIYQQQYDKARESGRGDARLRRITFKEGELVAVTRYGDVHRLNPRFIDTAKLERATTGGGDKTPSLSNALTYFADRSPQNRPPKAEPRRQPENDRPRTEPLVGKPREGAGLKVNVKGAAVALSSFVESLFGMGAAPSSPNHQQQQQAPQTGRGGGNAEQAWEEIYEAVQHGNSIPADSIRHLPPSELENLRRNGDAYIDNKITDIRREKEQEVARSWEDYDHERMGRER